jgi:HEAT repeat protein
MNSTIRNCVEQLQSSDATIRIAAAEQLCLLETEAQAAAIPLARAVGDSNESVSEHACAALESLGAPRASDVAGLAELLSNAHPDVGYWAATLLGRLEHDAKASVEKLSGSLSGHIALAVRQRAAWALGRIGESAAPALPQLKSAAQSDDPRLARLANEAIENISEG